MLLHEIFIVSVVNIEYAHKEWKNVKRHKARFSSYSSLCCVSVYVNFSHFTTTPKYEWKMLLFSHNSCIRTCYRFWIFVDGHYSRYILNSYFIYFILFASQKNNIKIHFIFHQLYDCIWFSFGVELQSISTYLHTFKALNDFMNKIWIIFYILSFIAFRI